MKKIIAAMTTFVLLMSIVSVTHAQVYVEKGDTLGKIAKRNGMSLKDIISLNPHIKNPNVIHIGDYIIVRSAVEKQKDLTDYARSLQDVTAYSYGANEFPFKTDCSGFVRGVYAKFGINLPRTSREQARTGTPVKFQDLQIGDLMFFSTDKVNKTITHVGIYLGQDFWLSNLNESKDVEILSSWGRWTQDYFMWGVRHKM